MASRPGGGEEEKRRIDGSKEGAIIEEEEEELMWSNPAPRSPQVIIKGGRGEGWDWRQQWNNDDKRQ